jgi:hypothetical protein
MRDTPQGQTRPPLVLLAGLIGLILFTVPLNIYNIMKHPGESRFWQGAVFLSSILIFVGLAAFIWTRVFRRR